MIDLSEETLAKAIASGIVAQNHMLELDEDGMGYFDDYDNKGYDCRVIAQSILSAHTVAQEAVSPRTAPGYGRPVRHTAMDRER